MIRPIIGYCLFLSLAFLLRRNRKTGLSKSWKSVVFGVLFQVAVIFALTNLPLFVTGLEYVANGVMKLKDATVEGSKFVFGYIGGGDLPFDLKEGRSPFVFAFQALPTVIIFGALAAILTYLKILPFLSKVVGYLFKLVFNVKDSIGIVAAAKIFVGQLEAPLLIKHKLSALSRSDMFIIMTLAFATASASVMPIYADAISHVCPGAMKHMLISSFISVISALIICSLIMPSEENEFATMETSNPEPKPYSSFMEAMSKGLSDGAFVWWCIVGSLIGTVALIAFVNYILALFPDYAGSPITLQKILGLIMYPFAWLIGVQNQDLTAVSEIIGTKVALNEVIAFFDLAKANISADSVIKTVYAINNFGNFSCIGITIGGLTALAPGQKCITEIAWKSFGAGLLASGLTAALMGILLAF
ncbi:MAG: hypothetical protein LBM19_01970 [Holosporales bacterium]|jgi:CNT family concentrative nucleoside transporter|nr:hypothetical protein [Holosporales bacterium]